MTLQSSIKELIHALNGASKQNNQSNCLDRLTSVQKDPQYTSNHALIAACNQASTFINAMPKGNDIYRTKAIKSLETVLATPSVGMKFAVIPPFNPHPPVIVTLQSSAKALIIALQNAASGQDNQFICEASLRVVQEDPQYTSNHDLIAACAQAFTCIKRMHNMPRPTEAEWTQAIVSLTPFALADASLGMKSPTKPFRQHGK